MIEAIKQLDIEMLVFLNQLGAPFYDPFWKLVTSVGVWIPLYLFFVFLIFRKFPTRDAILLVALAVLGVVLSDQGSVHLFKNVFERLRPCRTPGVMEFLREIEGGIRCGKFGFISSHASNTFMFAWFIGNVLKKKIPFILPILLLWALLVSYSRIYLGVHFPFDILGGLIFGVGIGQLLLILAKRMNVLFE